MLLKKQTNKTTTNHFQNICAIGVRTGYELVITGSTDWSYILYLMFYILYPMFYILHLISYVYILHPIFYILHPILHILHLISYTLYPLGYKSWTNVQLGINNSVDHCSLTSPNYWYTNLINKNWIISLKLVGSS